MTEKGEGLWRKQWKTRPTRERSALELEPRLAAARPAGPSGSTAAGRGQHAWTQLGGRLGLFQAPRKDVSVTATEGSVSADTQVSAVT